MSYLWILLIIVLLCSNPSWYKMILHCMCQGKIVIPVSGNISVFYEGVVEVPIKGLFNFVNIIKCSDTSYTDLFFSFCIGLRCSHDFLSKPPIEFVRVDTHYHLRSTRHKLKKRVYWIQRSPWSHKIGTRSFSHIKPAP